MVVTEFGIFMDDKLVQPKKAPSSILVTEYVIPIFVTEAGIIISLIAFGLIPTFTVNGSVSEVTL